MRLWHYKLIPYLPNSQLLAQWRELNSIFKKQDKHILINYIYMYPKDDLMTYSNLVITEMLKRGFKINYKNYKEYFNGDFRPTKHKPFKYDHTERYLLQCYFNLQEKYDRGQKDYDAKKYDALCDYIRKKSLCEPIIF